MFTGIVQEVGVLREKVSAGPAMRLRVQAPGIARNLRSGDSVACNGVCLTAEDVLPDGFTATAVPETLSRTALGDLQIGDGINLEPALLAGAPLGGHFMQGHVDGIAEVTAVKSLPGGGGKELHVRLPAAYLRYCVEKGSFGLHGLSLTIASLEGDVLRFALIPHTLSHTTLDKAAPGRRLNFEVDLLGKYVERLLASGMEAAVRTAAAPKPSGLDGARMENWGYEV